MLRFAIRNNARLCFWIDKRLLQSESARKLLQEYRDGEAFMDKLIAERDGIETGTKLDTGRIEPTNPSIGKRGPSEQSDATAQV